MIYTSRRRYLTAFALLLFTSCASVAYEWATDEFIEHYHYQEFIPQFEAEQKFGEPDVWALYPNGEVGFIRDLKIAYPGRPSRQGIEGNTIIEFDVNLEGMIENEKVVQSDHPDFSKTLLEGMQSTQRWVPAQKNGNFIVSTYRFQFVWRLGN